MRDRAEAVARDLANGTLPIEPGKASLVSTRNEVRRAWLAIGDILIRERQPKLASHVRRFSDGLPAAQTEKEWIAARLMARTPELHVREDPTY